MSLYDSDGKNERRSVERFKSSIPVLIQKRGQKRTSECTLLNISLHGFAVRLENKKSHITVEEEFFLVIDPNLFNISDVNKIQINSICERIEVSNSILGAIFSENTEANVEYIKLIVNCFKRINENDY